MKQLNYTEAFEELKQITLEIESGNISVDQLSGKINRASELIEVCKQKLTSTQEDVNLILKKME